MKTEIALFFDMDETIIAKDTIFAFFEKFGKKEKGEEVYEWSKNNPEKISQMYGISKEDVYPGMDVELICKEIIKEHNGVPLESFEELVNELPFYPRAEQFFLEFKEKYGDNIFIVSSSYDPIAKGIAKKIGIPIENVVATKLLEEDGKITKFIGPVMEAEKKEEAIKKIAKENNIDLQNCVGAGDGKHDHFFIRAITNAGGLGIATSKNEMLVTNSKAQIIMNEANYAKITEVVDDFAKKLASSGD